MLSQSINLYSQLAKKKIFKQKIKFGLKRIKKVLELLNNPEKKLKNVINIVGSDGKYSVLTSLKYIIEENGQKTSAFISPSLIDIRERFWIGDRFLSYKEIKKTISIIEKLKIPLTIFELFTLIYIINVAEKGNDYNLVEAGALFAKDSTNLFDFPKSQVIVNINKQHLNFVKKKNIREIIKQKVGYLSNYTKIYINNQTKSNLRNIKKILRKNLSEKVYSNNWKLIKRSNTYFYKDINTTIPLKNKNIHSMGLWQNLCISIKIAKDLGINNKIIKKAVPKIRFTGRMQYINKGKIKDKLFKNEELLIDGCHSQVSAKNLVKYLNTINLPKYGICGMTINKNPSDFLGEFKGVFEKIITVPLNNNKNYVSPNTLKKICLKNKIRSETAFNFIKAIKELSSSEKKIICVFGSLYLCGEFLKKN